MKKVILFFVTLSLLVPIFSEEINEDINGFNNNFIEEQFKPTIGNHFTAFGEAIGSNLFLMGVNRFIRKAPYAYISWDSMYKNLTNPWVWDQDEFVVNHLGHPYQGSYYYIAGRSNNLPFWESALVAITGSVTWELFAETETPSYNDLIVTTVAGISVGEMLHRLYFDAADINNFFGCLISPLDCINNAIWGGKINRPDGNVTSLSTKLFIGAITDKIFFTDSSVKGDTNYIPIYLGGGINIVYGNPYGVKTKNPYDHFDLNVKFSAAKNYYNLSIFSDGYIWSFVPFYADNIDTTMGMTLHYDFLFSSDINYSANAVGFTTKQHCMLPNNWDIKWDLSLNNIIMSASDFYFLFQEIIDPETNLENRIYDLGVGAGIKTSFSVSHPKVGSLYLFYFLDWVKTIKTSLPQKGSLGSALIGVGSISYEHNIYKTFSIGLEYSSYIKNADYTDIEDTFEYNQYLNIYFKNQFK